MSAENTTTPISPLGPAPGAIDLDGLLRRLHLPTVRRLYGELQERAETEGFSYRDYLALLVAEEAAHRAQTRIQRATRKARFPFLRTIEEFDVAFQTSVRLSLLGSYLGPELVSEGRSLILAGRPGTRKTHLAVATAAELIDELSLASREGRLRDALGPYRQPHVLVIDEVGYLAYSSDAANVLFQIVDRRYLARKPMVFTTNKSLDQWGRVLHDPDLAEAILDRILERGRLIELRGRSYRTRHLNPPSPPKDNPTT